MCFDSVTRRTAASTGFSADQFSASTRSAGLPLAFFFLLATSSILFTPAVQGQTAHFSGAQTVVDSGLSGPAGVAVDGSGNIYVADYNDSRVVMETLSGGNYTQTTIGSGLNAPSGVAVDAVGNVYIADSGNGQVLKETLSAGSYTQTAIATGLDFPQGVAVDGTGNVYIADTLNDRVLLETLSAGSYTQTVLASGLNEPAAVAVDGSGDVYIADSLNNRLLLETLSAGSYTETVMPFSGLNDPAGVAVDSNENVYIADTANNRVLLETLSGGTYTQTTIGAGLSGPVDVAVGGSGKTYVSDFPDNRLVEIQTAGVDLGSSNIATAKASVPFTFTFDTAGSLGAAPQVLTSGAAGLDFADDGTGTCTTNGTGHSYAAGDTCTVNVVFTPRFAGSRMGAVVLDDSNGNPMTTAYLYGTGVGPQVAFSPATQTVLLTGTVSAPYDVAVDGSGNVYIADPGNYRILKIAPGGAQSSIGVSGTEPLSVAVDGAGNVYASDANSGTVIKTAPDGTQTTITAAGVQQAWGLAVDGAGNVYVADVDHGDVVKVTPAGVQTTVPTNGLTSPFGLAVDGSGNLYIADRGNSRVVEVTPQGVQTTVAANLGYVIHLAVNGAGSIYAANGLSVMELASGGSETTIASGFGDAAGVGLDASGNVYVTDVGNDTVMEESVTAPPAMSFASTPTGSTSSDSPQILTLLNNGNAPLTFAAPATGMNPSLPAGFTFATGSTCPQLDTTSSPETLPAGVSCTAMVSFSPTTVGPISGSLAITDTNLNASPSVTQTATVSGTGIQGTQTITFPQPAAATYGAGPITLSATSSSGLAVTYAVTSGPGSLSGSTLSFTGTGTVVVTASQAGDTDYQAATPVADSITVNPATLTVTATNATRVYGAANPTLTGTYTGAVNGDTFTESYSTTATPSSAAGTYAITPTITGANLANYTVNYTNGILTISKVGLTVTAANATRAYGAANPALTGTYTGAVNGDTFTESYSTTATATSAPGTYTITPSITGTNLANYTVAYTDGTLTISKVGLTVAAADATRAYGAANPTLTGTYTGAVNGDSFTESYSTTASTSSAAGNYAITPNITGANLANYTVNYVNGTLTVNPATLTVVAANATRVYGTSNPVFTGTYSGAVNGDTFTVGGTTAAGTSSDVGSYAIVPAAAGAHLADYTVATSNGTLTVTAAGSATALVSSTGNATSGQGVTLTATVTSATTGTPGGTVTFSTAASTLGTGTLNANGVATLTTTALPIGTDTITASYPASTDFSASIGTAMVTVVSGVAPSFTVAPTTPSISVKQGQSVSTTLMLNPVGGYSGKVVFSCQGLPANSQCLFAQSPVNLTGNNQPVHVGLTIHTDVQQARIAAMPKPGQTPLSPILPALAFWFPGSMAGLAAFGRKKKLCRSGQRWLQLCLLLVATGAIAAGLTGCGGLGNVTPTGSSKVTVVATGISAGGVTTQNAVLSVTITR